MAAVRRFLSTGLATGGFGGGSTTSACLRGSSGGGSGTGSGGNSATCFGGSSGSLSTSIFLMGSGMKSEACESCSAGAASDLGAGGAAASASRSSRIAACGMPGGAGELATNGTSLSQDLAQAANVSRDVAVHQISGDPGTAIVRLAIEKDGLGCEAVIIAADDTSSNLPSADLIKRFLPGVKEFKSPLAGRTALIANARIKQLLGWKQEHFFPF